MVAGIHPGLAFPAEGIVAVAAWVVVAFVVVESHPFVGLAFLVAGTVVVEVAWALAQSPGHMMAIALHHCRRGEELASVVGPLLHLVVPVLELDSLLRVDQRQRQLPCPHLGLPLLLFVHQVPQLVVRHLQRPVRLVGQHLQHLGELLQSYLGVLDLQHLQVALHLQHLLLQRQIQ